MVVLDKSYYKLVAEFSNIKIRIIIGNQEYSGEVIHDELEEDYYPTYWSFNLWFQNDFFVEWGKRKSFTSEYENWLENLRLSFNRELNEEIDNCQTQFDRVNLLTDYKLRFSELRDNYSNLGFSIDGLDILDNDRIKYEYSEEKSINSTELKKIKSSFLSVQSNEIKKILETLVEKINLVETYSDNESNKTSKNKKNGPPLAKLDLYQTSLLFFYLNEVGVIKYKSSHEIASIVSQLTGHSEQNLRTEAFSKIVDVKRGLVGRRSSIQVDPSLNLGKVKDVILEILNKINDDLEKNRASKK